MSEEIEERDNRIITMVREFETEKATEQDRESVIKALDDGQIQYSPIDEDEFLITITSDGNKPKFSRIILPPSTVGYETRAFIELFNNSPFNFDDLQIKSKYFTMKVGQLLSGHQREIEYLISIPENVEGDSLEMELSVDGSYHKAGRYL